MEPNNQLITVEIAKDSLPARTRSYFAEALESEPDIRA